MAETENLLWTIKNLSFGSVCFKTDWNWREGQTSYSCDRHVKEKWISVTNKNEAGWWLYFLHGNLQRKQTALREIGWCLSKNRTACGTS